MASNADDIYRHVYKYNDSQCHIRWIGVHLDKLIVGIESVKYETDNTNGECPIDRIKHFTCTKGHGFYMKAATFFQRSIVVDQIININVTENSGNIFNKCKILQHVFDLFNKNDQINGLELNTDLIESTNIICANNLKQMNYSAGISPLLLHLKRRKQKLFPPKTLYVESGFKLFGGALQYVRTKYELIGILFSNNNQYARGLFKAILPSNMGVRWMFADLEREDLTIESEENEYWNRTHQISAYIEYNSKVLIYNKCSE